MTKKTRPRKELSTSLGPVEVVLFEDRNAVCVFDQGEKPLFELPAGCFQHPYLETYVNLCTGAYSNGLRAGYLNGHDAARKEMRQAFGLG